DRVRKTVSCVCCGKTGEHKGRGLRSACWDRYDRKGQLDLFPRTRGESDYVMAGRSDHIMERVEMFAELAKQGMRHEDIASYLGVTERTLLRYAAHLRNMGRGGVNYG